MAGKPLLSSFEDSETNYSEAFDFSFNFEGDPSQITASAFTYPSNFHNKISGNFEFRGDQNPAYWRSMVALFAICAILSTGFYYLLGDYKAEMATYISLNTTKNKVAPVKTQEKLELISSETVVQEKVEPVVVPKSIEQTTSIIGKIKQKEKSKSQLSVPKIKTETNTIPKRINSPPVLAEVENFKTKSLAKAKSLSANTGRYIFIKFGAEWCVSCRLMENNALKNQTVKDLLDSKFVVLEVDIDEPIGSIIKEELYVDRLPTLVILDELGNQMRRQEEAIGTSGLIDMLSSVAAFIDLEGEENMTFLNEKHSNHGEK